MENVVFHDSEIPAKDQQIITASAFIHHNFDGTEKVFLAKRADTKKFLPGVYELPGGHINYGEEIVDGLRREIVEEFGMKLEVGDPFAVFTYINQIKGSHSIEVIYFARFEGSIENIIIHPEDHSGFDWIAEHEMQKVIDANKKGNDPEILAIGKGFSLLNGISLKF